MALKLKATSGRTRRARHTMFLIDSVLTDEDIHAAARATVAPCQSRTPIGPRRPQVDDKGDIRFGNGPQASWALTYTVLGSGERGYVVSNAIIVRDKILDSHEIAFFLNAFETVLRRTDRTAEVSIGQRNLAD